MSEIFEGIEKSFNDDRSYRVIKLSNKLEVLLISDPETQKSAAACDVNIGSMADPAEAPGLAHFLEHMLFLGTEKYPVENAYSSFLNSHGGHSNAYTSQENTVYYFDVQNDFFEEAIDMFGSFFTCPLLTESATSREITAVDNENTKNLQADNWRNFQLLKSLASPEHPFSKFSTGNKDTLDIENIHQLLVSFYKKHYSANIMKFALYGKEPLDTLQKWAEEKLSSIVNKDLSREVVGSSPFPSESLPRFLEVVPVKDKKTLQFHFPVPAVESHWRAKPIRYLSHLVGHESTGSILAALKKKGYANGLAAYMSESFPDFAAFGISIDVTENGLSHIDDIIECVFAYIGMMNAEGPKEWIYTENIVTQDMNFRYVSKTEPSSYATNLANNMHMFPAKNIITGASLTFQVDLDLVSLYMKYLTPENCIIMLSNKAFEGKTNLSEKWYGTKYNDKQLTASQLSSWSAAVTSPGEQWSRDLFLPLPNSFVPTDFELRYKGPRIPCADDADRQTPSLIERSVIHTSIADIPLGDEAEDEEKEDKKEADEAKSEEYEEGGEEEEEEAAAAEGAVEISLPATGRKLMTWFMQDKAWVVPKINVLIKLETLQAYSTPLNVALTDIFARVLEEILVDVSYYADCAGLHFSVHNSSSGIDLTCYGFHHKLPLLVEKVVVVMMQLSAGQVEGIQDVYQRMKEKVEQEYANFRFHQPYMHCMVSTLNCLDDPRWSVDEKLLSLKSSTFSDFSVFSSVFLRMLNTEMFVHGNATQADARTLSEKIQSALGALPLPFAECPVRRTVALKRGESYLYRQHAVHSNPNEVNSALENVYIVCSEDTLATASQTASGRHVKWGRTGASALLCLFVHMASEPMFDQLRTKEQLGYIVHTSTVKFGRLLAMRVVLQSNSKNGTFLDKRVETFLLNYRNVLEAVSAEALADNIQAVIELLLEKPKNLQKETNRFWGEISSGTYLFDRKIREANFLRTVTLDDILEFYDIFVSPLSAQRTKFSSQFFGAKRPYPSAEPAGVVLVTNHTTFKRAMRLLPCENLSEVVPLSAQEE